MPSRVPSAQRNTKANVRIVDMPGFLRSLGILPHQWRTFERIFQRTASLIVADEARSMARSGTPVQRRSAADIHTGGPGVVVYGGRGYSMGAEFGAIRYKQFSIWRGNRDDAGYFFWPAIRRFRDQEMLEQYVKDVWRAVKPAFPHR